MFKENGDSINTLNFEENNETDHLQKQAKVISYRKTSGSVVHGIRNEVEKIRINIPEPVLKSKIVNREMPVTK